MNRKLAVALTLTLLTGTLSVAFDVQRAEASVASAQVGVKSGDWIKCTYTISGWPYGTPYPEWLKVEFLSVEGTNATVRVTMHMSDGTEQSDTMTVDVVAGGEDFQGLSGFVIPANCTIGDSVYMSVYGNVTIAGETTGSYAGATRTVVYASFSQYGTQLTYYWDKLTGVMVEASTISGSVTGTAKATETNMWQVRASSVHNLVTGLNYTTIQEAIDANETLDGHIIFVEEGVYYEHVSVDKSLALIGEDRETTIVDGENTGNVVTVSANYVEIKSFRIKNSGPWPTAGILLQSVQFGYIHDNNVSDNFHDIMLDNSSNNRISENIAQEDYRGAGLFLTSTSMSESACTNNTIDNNLFSHAWIGIRLEFSCRNKIYRNICIDNWIGISTEYWSENNIIINNVLNGSGQDGINLGSSFNLVRRNILGSNQNGFRLEYAHNNTLIENTIISGNIGGFASNSNRIFHNNFFDMGTIRTGTSFNNTWDDGYPSGGNYWSDHDGTDFFSGSFQNETGSDGLGDEPYVVDLDNLDNYPLMRPWMPFEGQAIYVRADGNVDPSGAPLQRKGDSYTFTSNVTSSSDGIVIERDNIVVDGAGYTLQGTNNYMTIGTIVTGRSNVTIKNTNIKNYFHGISLYSSSNSTISGNNITANFMIGIMLTTSSSNSTISGNNITNSRDGISLYSSSSNSTISGNNIIANNEYGILLYSSSSNSISGNNITNNGDGIYLYISSSNNTISGNNIATNNEYGIRLYSSSDSNSIFHNNLINNPQQVYSSDSVNVWDDGYPSGGNYWSDYSGTDANHDGIGDTPYIIDANNTDNYPLMGMFSDFNVTSEFHVNPISNSTITDFQFDGAAIRFNVSGENGTAGFCRMCVPKELMNEPYHVFVNGTEILPPPQPLPCSNSTHNYLYINYTHSTQEVIIIPELPSFMILPLFMMATLLAAIVWRKKRIYQRPL